MYVDTYIHSVGIGDTCLKEMTDMTENCAKCSPINGSIVCTYIYVVLELEPHVYCIMYYGCLLLFFYFTAKMTGILLT